MAHSDLPHPDPLRSHLSALLSQPQAHATLAQVLDGFPLARINERPGDLPYSAFEVLWHLRFTQRDLLNYLSAGTYSAPEWPADYWPHRDGSKEEWQAQADAYAADQAAVLALLDSAPNLYAPVPHAQDASHTVLRSLLLIADHTAYHVGQLALLKRLLGGGDSQG
ncbi:DinB family protein [Deinococcus sp. Marseille-Q6407]|uniref:DinB family protein n=1 Tax=Deinococcus sp. Marseille-Q6407 TaxID=2969223 RepID=UPI0021BF2D7A|nr:DinB family protein [Deinococcus sp. Marseille-Q6407]